jgi:hypothetical protein
LKPIQHRFGTKTKAKSVVLQAAAGAITIRKQKKSFNSAFALRGCFDESSPLERNNTQQE